MSLNKFLMLNILNFVKLKKIMNQIKFKGTSIIKSKLKNLIGFPTNSSVELCIDGFSNHLNNFNISFEWH